MAEPSVTGESSSQKKKMSAIFRELALPGQPRSCSDLLGELETPPHLDAHALSFESVGGRDVYNITAPFELDGKLLIFGRVEQRETELSEIVAFESQAPDRWTPCFTHPQFDGLQDPCITWADDELVVGGVRYPVPISDERIGYKMDFYRGKTLESLQHFLSGPLGMKDIRFKQLPDGRVCIFSRPQGKIGGLGKIGFRLVPSWDEVTTQAIATAPLFESQMLDSEWGGVNEIHLLSNGRLGALGHIACFDGQRKRHYYPMAFMVDPEAPNPSPIRIIAQRSFFPAGDAKRSDLVDVVFSGGMVRNGDQTANLYAGTSDAAAAVVTLRDPFLEYEM